MSFSQKSASGNLPKVTACIRSLTYCNPLKIIFNIIVTSTSISSKCSLYLRISAGSDFYACYMCGAARLYRQHCHTRQIVALRVTELRQFSCYFLPDQTLYSGSQVNKIHRLCSVTTITSFSPHSMDAVMSIALYIDHSSTLLPHRSHFTSHNHLHISQHIYNLHTAGAWPPV